MKNTLIGAHISFLKKGQLLQSLQDFIKIGANSGAFYVSNSRGYMKGFDLDEDNIKEAKKFAKDNGLNLEDIIVHSLLIGNIANTDKEKPVLDKKRPPVFESTVNSYIFDLKRLKKLGIKYYNFHPGSAKNQEQGILKCAEGINLVHKATEGDDTVLCIETVTKKGNYIGHNFSQIKEIINNVEDKKRIGVVIDTCHTWDAGYDWNDVDKVIEEFDEIIGLKYLKGLHINDSKNPLNSNKDRHANIGKGEIGLKNLINIVNHPKLRHLPKILETPYQDDNFAKWKHEIELLTNVN